MVRVTVELLPFGRENDEKGKSIIKHLGTCRIVNDGTRSHDRGNYKVTLSTFHSPKQVWKKGEVKDFLRIERGPWDLLYLALKDTVGKRNKKQDGKA